MRSRIRRRGASLVAASLAVVAAVVAAVVVGVVVVGEAPAAGEHDGPPPAGGDGPPVIEGSPTPQVHRPGGGGAVRIYGAGFGGATAVTFGGVAAPDFRVVDGDLIVATVPAAGPGYAHVEVTDDEGTASSDLDGDGVVDEPTVAGVEVLERGAILYRDATVSLSPATGLVAGDPVEVAVEGHQPFDDIALTQLNPLAGFLEHQPADADEFPPGSPYGDALTLSGTDANGDNVPHDVAVRAGAGFDDALSDAFNDDDTADYDDAATCPVTQASADHGLERCSITASQLGMGRVQAQVALVGDPVPARPTLVLTAASVADGDTVEVSGANWNAAPHFGSDTVPDDPGETTVIVEICDAALALPCSPAVNPEAGVDLVRYVNAASDPTGLPVDGVLSGAALSGSFTVAGSDACAPECVVRVRQQRYDIEANAPVPVDDADAFVEATVALEVTGPVTTGLTVAVSAEPSSVAEPGGEFTFTVAVTNTGTRPVTITGLDDETGSLEGRGTCALDDEPVAAGATFTCSFTEEFTGLSGDTLVHTVTATAANDQAMVVTGSGTATVSIDAAPQPVISVTVTANPPSLAGTGGPFTVTVEVANTGDGSVTITSLSDVVYDPLSAQGDCDGALGTKLAPGGRYMCSFEGDFVGQPGDSQVDTVEATAVDGSGTVATATDGLTVRVSAASATGPGGVRPGG